MGDAAPQALESRPAVEGERDSRVALSPAAVRLLRTLWDIHGPLMFHQSGGCCDGSSPMCYPTGDFRSGDADVLLGVFDLDDDAGSRLGELEFWMSREQFEYWRHTHLTVDVVDGRGSGFSVEAPEGKRFLIRSRLMG
ncbi:DUF779 domain-containing protein [Rothia halotolerans]|uniref:DUF779 domain-containing protein n=1 Tax=Rothia halotolerans TaxID=405770 RepID=UPI00101D07C2|nr:DUF779 domain-containing protein [Rothia halotolerans]